LSRLVGFSPSIRYCGICCGQAGETHGVRRDARERETDRASGDDESIQPFKEMLGHIEAHEPCGVLYDYIRRAITPTSDANPADDELPPVRCHRPSIAVPREEMTVNEVNSRPPMSMKNGLLLLSSETTACCTVPIES
jgi:hypothetical protein